MSDTDPLPWLARPLTQALTSQHGHAVLVSGPAGVGQFELAIALAKAWLCEATERQAGQGACGECAACKLHVSYSHPDLLVLLPELLQAALGWGQGDDAASEKASKAKPSKEIKVDAVRRAVGFAQGTGARGRAKVVVVYPAERMNGIAAHALLKTLEEPPGVTRFILASAAPDALLPTIRSRCQTVMLALPDPALAVRWLAGQGVTEPELMLAATGGQPQQVLDWQQQGIDAAGWQALPQALARGDAGVLAGWQLPQVVGALQKVCHDAMCLAAGAAPRYFPAAAFDRLPLRGDAGVLQRLGDWSRELSRTARHIEHPFSVPLMIDALIGQARAALAPPQQRDNSGKAIRGSATTRDVRGYT
ncbi:DNA polymerase III subunit delta' [Piscinibacter sakaiensis]|uniref:DNA polymerase III subunit delta' n=1 Tax=Piscinibacter sakaiensis TaxID=1547922 RepID=UPI003AAC0943